MADDFGLNSDYVGVDAATMLQLAENDRANIMLDITLADRIKDNETNQLKLALEREKFAEQKRVNAFKSRVDYLFKYKSKELDQRRTVAYERMVEAQTKKSEIDYKKAKLELTNLERDENIMQGLVKKQVNVQGFGPMNMLQFITAAKKSGGAFKLVEDPEVHGSRVTKDGTLMLIMKNGSVVPVSKYAQQFSNIDDVTEKVRARAKAQQLAEMRDEGYPNKVRERAEKADYMFRTMEPWEKAQVVKTEIENSVNNVLEPGEKAVYDPKIGYVVVTGPRKGEKITGPIADLLSPEEFRKKQEELAAKNKKD